MEESRPNSHKMTVICPRQQPSVTHKPVILFLGGGGVEKWRKISAGEGMKTEFGRDTAK